MASASKKYNVILMEAAEAAEDDDCEDLPKDTNLRELKIYLSARGVDIGQDVDWMGKFNSCRKMIRVENKRPVGERTSSEESGRSKESGYFSDPFRVKNGKPIVVQLVNNRCPQGQAPVGFCRSDQVEGNYISQKICERYSLRKESRDPDGKIRLAFREKEGTKPVLKRCAVMPDDECLADVVFGKEPSESSDSSEDEEDGPGIHHQKASGSRTRSQSEGSSARRRRIQERNKGKERIAYGLGNAVKDLAVEAFNSDAEAEKFGKRFGLALAAAEQAAEQASKASKASKTSKEGAGP